MLKKCSLMAVYAVVFFTTALVGHSRNLEAKKIDHDSNFSISLNEKSIELLDQHLAADLDNPRAVFVEILKSLP